MGTVSTFTVLYSTCLLRWGDGRCRVLLKGFRPQPSHAASHQSTFARRIPSFDLLAPALHRPDLALGRSRRSVNETRTLRATRSFWRMTPSGRGSDEERRGDVSGAEDDLLLLFIITPSQGTLVNGVGVHGNGLRRTSGASLIARSKRGRREDGGGIS
jgi:hypothetical protein